MPIEIEAADIGAVAQALRRRARTAEGRAEQLAEAYLRASVDRAVAVTTAAELPPTAMKQAQISLLIRLLTHFEDMPTQDELAALLRITPTVARTLLSEVLAASDEASGRLLKSVFERATKSDEQAGGAADIPNGWEWAFRTPSDLNLAKGQLEFRGVEYRTRKSTDGSYVLLVDPYFDPAAIDEV
jgi:hypothetical protein